MLDTIKRCSSFFAALFLLRRPRPLERIRPAPRREDRVPFVSVRR